jgi:hypothetical protein
MPEILHCGYHTPVILAASSVILTVPSVILTAPPVIFDPTFCHLDRRERSLSSWHQAPIVPDSAPAIGPMGTGIFSVQTTRAAQTSLLSI